MRVLAETFDVTLACPHDEPVTESQHKHVQSICNRIITAPTGNSRWLRAGVSTICGKSLTEGLFHSAAVADQVLAAQRTSPFDAVLVFCSSMFPYVDHAEFKETPTIVDLVDVDSEKWQQMSHDNGFPKSLVYNLEYRRVHALEQRIADHADAIILVSDQEAQLFRSKIKTSTPVIGVSNGVDTDYFQPPTSASPTNLHLASSNSHLATRHSPPSSSPLATRHSPLASSISPLATRHSQLSPRLIFTGVLDYSPNVEGMVWFCSKILPLLRERLDVQLDIVGRRPSQSVKDLGEIEGVNLVGEVPDVRPYLHQANIAVSPLKLARGIQNKVLEAMACGLPVITTTQSAEGIDARDGEEFIIADDEATWVEQICVLAAAPDRRSEIGRAARELVVKNYAWSARMSEITNLLEASIAR